MVIPLTSLGRGGAMRIAFAAFISALLSFCRYGTLVSFCALIGVVTIQIAGRLPGVPSYAWTEELARCALVYVVAFSCGMAVLRSELVNVDLFVTLLPKPFQRRIEQAVDVIVLAFSLTILPGSWDYVAGSIGERARSVDFPMVAIYLVTLIIPVALAIFSVARFCGLGRVPSSSGHGTSL
jgi:TRAP-type C4-dicarboxylate transport system permease small subunit